MLQIRPVIASVISYQVFAGMNIQEFVLKKLFLWVYVSLLLLVFHVLCITFHTSSGRLPNCVSLLNIFHTLSIVSTANLNK